MNPQLSPYRLGKARDIYNYYNIFNSLSWNLLVGSIITLFALRLGANSTYIGLISAMVYISYFFLPLGKILARHFSIIGIFSFAWTWRAICMILAVAAPFAEYAGRRDLALWLTLIGVFAFHFFRGIGMVGNNPVLNELAVGPDRGSYLTQIQVVYSAVTMFGSFLVAMTLGREPPVYLYSILLAAGVISGIISGGLLKKVPEPPWEDGGEKTNLFEVFKNALSQSSLRLFMTIFFLVALVSGVTRAFVVVYAREVFAHNDGMISLYTVFGGLGYLMIGLVIKFLVDRIGTKPIFIVCVIVGLVSMIPIVFFPLSAVDNITTAILFLSFLFFMLNFGFLGSEGIAQTYFLGLIPMEKMLDLGILYFLIFGIAGAAGSFLAGLLLDILSGLGVSSFVSFKILFGSQIVMALAALILQRRLTSLGSLSLKGALEVIFSFRDLRAISLLDRLNKVQDSREEELLLGALHDTPSRLAIKGLLERARSPRLVTRLESIRALETMKTLSEEAEKALIDDIINNPFTTAYISARTLGNHNCSAAIPLLRELAVSTDYMLAGEAMIALAKLKDEAYRPQIEKIILETQNPRLKIMGVEALGMYRSANSLSVLLDILRVADPPPYLRDEVTLAMSAILDTQNQFYSLLVRYLADNALAATLGMDEAESAFEFYHASLGGRKKDRKDPELALIAKHAKNIQAAVSSYIHDKNGVELSRWILELPGFAPDSKNSIAQIVLAEAALDDELSAHNRLRLLIVHWAAWELRVWTKRLKAGGH
jgi:MFS family permease